MVTQASAEAERVLQDYVQYGDLWVPAPAPAPVAAQNEESGLTR